MRAAVAAAIRRIEALLELRRFEISAPSGQCVDRAMAGGSLEELLEEAKRRTVLFVIFVVTIAYCMSLTSKSVLVNIPIAIVLLAIARRISLELIIRWKPSIPEASSYQFQYTRLSPADPLVSSRPLASTKWRSQIDSPAVEAAIAEFTHRIVAEFVTNLWYAAVTPDRDVPQEIENIINGAIGEVSVRAKQVNLITLLTRDIVDVVANHLQVYREVQASLGVEYLGTLSSTEREEKIKQTLASTKKLHPAVSSVEMEIQVLQRLMDGVLAIVLKSEEANCKIVRCFSRELLACAVMRQVMNLAAPRFINEVIEFIVIASKKKSFKAPAAELRRSDSTALVDLDAPLRAESGVELAEVVRNDGEDNKKVPTPTSTAAVQSSRSGTQPDQQVNPSQPDQQVNPLRSGDWAHALDAFNQRKTQALAPEHLDNLWAKGRNYKRKDAKKKSGQGGDLEQLTGSEPGGGGGGGGDQGMAELRDMREGSVLTEMPVTVHNDYYAKPQEQSRVIVLGEDSNKQTAMSRVIHHPLETPEVSNDENSQRSHRHRRSQSSGGADHEKYSEASKKPAPGGIVGYKSKLSCKVSGAHYEKTGNKSSFAVYSISVWNVEGQSWVVLRRYRNFEQLHRRLRDMPHYTLSLPPKRFLSSNLDNAFVRERCVLLNKYLKDLLSIPSIAELHEVWDFLSAKSQNYAFGNSVSIMKTLAVNVDDAVDDVFRQIKGVSGGVLAAPATDKRPEGRGSVSSSDWNPAAAPTSNHPSDEDAEDYGGTGWHSDSEVHKMEHSSRLDASLSDGHSPEGSLTGSEMVDEPEWNPPKLTAPMLNLVDIVFELEGRGWIRRQILWIAKQVLQLGMADAIDDWLLTQVQYLRSEDVIVSGIKRIQQLLWPDGIFFIKHPKFQLPGENQAASQPSFDEELEAARRKMIVRELLQDQAPTALVSLIGRKQYTRCASDIYGFIQSQVCVKQLAYSLLEKLLGTAFPELEDLILEVHGATA